jgi:ATP/maltotriose-dependent transcriptional regulator MalT
VADYLTAEVLDGQPASLRRFLLATSVLNRLCAPLCGALLAGDGGTPDIAATASNSQAILEELERANVFLVPLDDERRWYRYHHLFADALRARLTREIGMAGMNELYRRARLWHEQHDLPEEAVNYALVGRDWPAAAKIMEQLSTSLWTSSRHVLNWIESLPEEEVDQSPDLCMWYAGWQLTCGEFGHFERLLDSAERVLRSSGQHAKLAGVYVYRALAGFLREDAQPTVENALQAMAYFDGQNQFLQAPTVEKLARGYFLKGDLAEAERVWAETSGMAQAADGQRTMLFVRAAQGEIQRVRGQLRQAARLDQELLQQIGARPADIIKIRAMGRLASLYYEWNQLDQAQQYAHQALELAGQTRREVFARFAYLTLARIYWALGEADQAFEAIEQAKEVAQRMGGEHPMLEVSAHQVWLWLADASRTSSSVAGQSITAAIDWADAQHLDLDGELPYEGQITHLALCRVFIVRNRADRAIRLLERMLAAAEAAGRIGEMVEMLALKALAHHAQHQTDQALDTLAQALTLAEPEGYVHTFIDEGLQMAALLRDAHTRALMPSYVAMLLDAFSTQDKGTRRQGDKQISTSPIVAGPLSTSLQVSLSLVEPLSKRELEVLSLMAQGLTNNEIAQRIVVSAQTVKVHTRNIYGKLDVNSRMQAVAKAKALGLLTRS